MSTATVAPAPPHLTADEQAAYARDGIVIPGPGCRRPRSAGCATRWTG